MGKKEKLIKRFLSEPKDFTFKELVTLLGYLGYRLNTAGKTSGSSLRFIHPVLDKPITIHKPHPDSIIPEYQVKNIAEYLNEEGLL